MPTRPCRGTPVRKPTAIPTSPGSSRASSAARIATFLERELVSVTSREAVTTSASRVIARPTLCRHDAAVESTAPVPTILDCDPGHDDMVAILLAAAHPRIELLAITTVAGNGTLERTTHNARAVCSMAGIRDVPIAAGAPGPLVGTLRTAE